MVRKVTAFEMRRATPQEIASAGGQGILISNSTAIQVHSKGLPYHLIQTIWFEEADEPITVEDLAAGDLMAQRAMIGIWRANEAARGAPKKK